MKNKILITGNKGFIGNYLIRYFNKTENVVEIVNTEGIDFCDAAEVNNLPNVDVIVHLAARTFIPDSFIKSKDYYYNNIVSTLNILEKAKTDKAKVVFLSTYVYGAPIYLPVDENHPIQPMNPYTQSKVICEQLCEAYSRDFLIPVIVLRPFNIYGPGQSFNFFIPTILSQIDKEVINLQDSKPKRDYIFINDLIDLIVLLLKQDFIGYEVYNVGTGVSYSVKEIVNIILDLSKSSAKVNFTDTPRQGEVNDCYASVEKLFLKYQWNPKTPLIEGLKEVLKY